MPHGKRQFGFHDPNTGSALPLEKRQIRHAVSFLNPTQVSFHSSDTLDPHVWRYDWSSRNNRKGRHAVAASPSIITSTDIDCPDPSSTARAVIDGIWRMVVQYPIWDISWLVAISFTVGSVVWVLNAFFVYLPDVRPNSAFRTEVYYGGGITAFIGATIFEVGSILLVLEAVNENMDACFGWAIKQVLHPEPQHEDGFHQLLALKPNKDTCLHHHQNRHNLVGHGQSKSIDAAQIKSHKSESQSKGQERSWQWFPSWHCLRSHYFHELGFLASFIQLLAATVFWISGFTALPGIYNHMSPGLLNGLYWTPQVLGGTGFIISGLLFMLETQKKWYIPAPHVLGWHIGALNFIGGLGFTLSPAFGYKIASWATYEAGLSTFWGSWAFLVGSVIQWYESLEKYPLRVDKKLL